MNLEGTDLDNSQDRKLCKYSFLPFSEKALNSFSLDRIVDLLLNQFRYHCKNTV